MSRPHEKTFSELCRPGGPGYALDYSLWINHMKMDDAIEDVSRRIDECIKSISEGWRRPVKEFYIGKSHFNCIKKRKFSPTNPATWRLGNGIGQRYHDHITHDHGRNGLVVVAVVTKESIHSSHLSDRTLAHQEEYALTLEKQLIQDFKKWDPSRLANRTQEPGRTDRESSIAYAVYITFTMEDWREERYLPIDCYPTDANLGFQSASFSNDYRFSRDSLLHRRTQDALEDDFGQFQPASFNHDHRLYNRDHHRIQLGRNDNRMTGFLLKSQRADEYQRIPSPSPFQLPLHLPDSREELRFGDKEDSTLPLQEMRHNKRIREEFRDSMNDPWVENVSSLFRKNISTHATPDDVIIIDDGSTPSSHANSTKSTSPECIVIDNNSDSSYLVQSKATHPSPDVIVVGDDPSPEAFPEIVTIDESTTLMPSKKNSANPATPTKQNTLALSKDKDLSSALLSNKNSESDYSGIAGIHLEMGGRKNDMLSSSEKLPTPAKLTPGRSFNPSRRGDLSGFPDEERVHSVKKRKSLTLAKNGTRQIVYSTVPNTSQPFMFSSTPSIKETSMPSIIGTTTPFMKETETSSIKGTSTPTFKMTSMSSIKGATFKTASTPSTKRITAPFIKGTITPATKGLSTPSIKETSSSSKRTDTPSIKEIGTPFIKNTGTPSLKETSTPSIKRTDTPSIKNTGTPSLKETSTPSIKRTGTPSIKETSPQHSPEINHRKNEVVSKISPPVKNTAERSIGSFLPFYHSRKRKLSCSLEERALPLNQSKKRKSLTLDKKRPKLILYKHPLLPPPRKPQ